MSAPDTAVGAGTGTSVDVDIAIIDTGIDDHQDLTLHRHVNCPSGLLLGLLGGRRHRVRHHGPRRPAERPRRRLVQRRDDEFATHSNYGEVVDIAAPGSCIPSTQDGGVTDEPLLDLDGC